MQSWLRELLDDSPPWGPWLFVAGPIAAVVLAVVGVVPWGIALVFGMAWASTLFAVTWNRSRHSEG